MVGIVLWNATYAYRAVTHWRGLFFSRASYEEPVFFIRSLAG